METALESERRASDRVASVDQNRAMEMVKLREAAIQDANERQTVMVSQYEARLVCLVDSEPISLTTRFPLPMYPPTPHHCLPLPYLATLSYIDTHFLIIPIVILTHTSLLLLPLFLFTNSATPI